MDDLQLLREFRTELDPPPPAHVDRARMALFEAIDADTVAGRRSRSPRRRRRMVALIAAPAGIAACAAVVVVATVGGEGSGTAEAAIVHRADAALAPPPNEILHTRVAGGGFGAESWQETSAPYLFVAMKGRLDDQFQQGGDATSSSYYDHASNTIHEHTGGGTAGFDDPISQVRNELRAGQARVLGSATVDRVATYKIEVASKGQFGPGDLVMYVDQHTYRPLQIDDPQADGTVVRLRVLALEYLPETPANLRLVSLVDRHPGSRVVHDGSKAASPGK